jgi:hypothetical protein
MDDESPTVPERFAVAVLMERRRGVTPWQAHAWVPVGLIAGAVAEGAVGVPLAMPADGDVLRELWRGLDVRLHRDEVESYYHNLVSPTPLAFVIMREGAADHRAPAIVTLCFDEANAYVEGDDQVESVPMPPELVQWLEHFVVDNYVPERRTRRERKAWTDPKTP